MSILLTVQIHFHEQATVHALKTLCGMQKKTKTANVTMKRLFLIALIILTTKYGTAQFIDKYGINIGASNSNQLWDYKLIPDEIDKKDYKWGFLLFISAEKHLNKLFSLRPEFGYIQKGFKNKEELYWYNPTTGVMFSSGVANKNVVYHDLAFNLALKITPFKMRWSPYALIGLRTDYTISYKDIIVVDNYGYESNMFNYQIDKFNKFNIGGLMGLGLEIHDQFYIEFVYNPSITNSYNDPNWLVIKDVTWDIKFGININKLLKKYKHDRITQGTKHSLHWKTT